MIHRIAVIAIIAGSWVATAQTANTGAAQPAFGQELPYTEVLTPPMPVSGVVTPLRLSSENPRINLLTGSMTVSSAYDDNMLASARDRVGDFSYLFFPSLDIMQARERWTWDFGYSPGFTINQRLNERNQSTHNLHFLFGYRLSPHVTVQLHDNFDRTTNLFSSFLDNGNVQPGPLQQPNTSMITPLTNRTGNTSGVDLTYQFGVDSMVGASGGYYFVNYGQTQLTSGQNYSLVDSRSSNADGFYAHRFAHRHWLGFIYNFQRLNFDQGYRTDVQRVLWFYSVSIGSRMSFSLWAGPERSTNFLPNVISTGTTSKQAHWHGAGGLVWSVQGTRTGLSLGYTRQTSDGGGLAQAVIMQQANAEVRRRLTQRWTAILGARYGRNSFLGSTATPALRTWSGNAGFDYQITDHWGTGLRYGRDQQKYVDALPALSANRNRAWVSISYSFSRPLGR